MVDLLQNDEGAVTVFDLSSPGRRALILPSLDVPETKLPLDFIRGEAPRIPELSQPDVVRHFTRLSGRNYCIDTGFYPLGSCSMKYNPRINEAMAQLENLTRIHPLQPVETIQGSLTIMHELQEMLVEITGMDAVGLNPAAGAQGELAGVFIAKWYFASIGQEHRNLILVPDSAHGTNPATAAMAGFDVQSIPTGKDGDLDFENLKETMEEKGDRVAALMLTLPSTLGLFERRILDIAEILHRKGALLYGDGANMNAMLGRVKPGDLGFDIFHLNLHKTFSTPHGGGGPGSGPVCVKDSLAPFLPTPHVEADSEGESFRLATPEQTIGRVGLFHGNFGMLVRANAYIKSLGAEGLREISGAAVLNANYILARLREAYRLPYDRLCMHEVVISGSRQKANGVRTLDIAKRLIDYGFHPPTVYFPLIVAEAMMIEPTEAEGIEALDAFCEAMLAIAQEVEDDPDVVLSAPHSAPVRRVDEATAARKPELRWWPKE